MPLTLPPLVCLDIKVDTCPLPVVPWSVGYLLGACVGSGNGVNTRSVTERESDRARLGVLLLQRVSHEAIAAELGISRQMVTADAKLIRNRWIATTTMDLDEAKSVEVAKIDRLERVYWDAWDLSSTLTLKDKDGNTEEVKVVGDPVLLSGILHCIDRRCKLLGLDAPVKIDSRHMEFTIAFDTPSQLGDESRNGHKTPTTSLVTELSEDDKRS